MLPFVFGGVAGGGLSGVGIMMSVPGSAGRPPSIRMVRPAVTSAVVCARRGCSYTATLAAASIRAASGTRRSRITASRKSFGDNSGLSKARSGCGSRISGSADFAIRAIQSQGPGSPRLEWRTWLRALRPPYPGFHPYHTLYIVDKYPQSCV